MPLLLATLFYTPSLAEELASDMAWFSRPCLALTLLWLLVVAVLKLLGRPARLSPRFWWVAGCSVALFALGHIGVELLRGSGY